MSTVVLQVKLDVYKVSDIPVRHQVWSGWPEKTSDDAVSFFFFFFLLLFIPEFFRFCSYCNPEVF